MSEEEKAFTVAAIRIKMESDRRREQELRQRPHRGV